MEKPVNTMLKHLGRTDHLQLSQFQDALKQRMDMVINMGIFCPCSQCFLFLRKTIVHYKRSTGCLFPICLHTEFETVPCQCRPSHHFHTVNNTPEGIFIAAPKSLLLPLTMISIVTTLHVLWKYEETVNP